MYAFLGTFAALLVTVVHASPVAVPALSFPNISPAIGFDPNTVHAPTPDNVPALQGIELTPDLLDNLTSVPHYEGSLPQGSSGNTKRLNQPDPRYQFTDPNHWPWRTVGRVNWDGASTYCTGALIGPRHVLTARHCVPPNNGGFVFCPSYNNGPNPTFGCAQATYYYFYTDNSSEYCGYKEDWVVVIIDQRFGDGLGYFGAGTVDSSQFNIAEWEYTGYAGDRGSGQSWREDNAQLPTGNGYYAQQICDTYGPIFSNDNSAPGDSGAPLWYNGGTIWGVLHGGATASNGVFETLFASSNNMISTIGYARQQYP